VSSRLCRCHPQEFCHLIGPIISLRAKAGILDGENVEDQIKHAAKDTFFNSLGFAQDVERMRKMLTYDRYVINPHGKYMRSWDQVTMYALLFVAIVTPAEISFNDTSNNNDTTNNVSIAAVAGGAEGHGEMLLFYINRVVDLVFLADLVIQFFLAYPDTHHGHRLIKSLSKIRAQYLRGWFAIDVVSLIPFDIIASLTNFNTLVLVRVIRMLRLLKMFRLLRSSRILQRWECDLAVPYWRIELTKIIVYLMLMMHWMACAWGMLDTLAPPDRVTWLDAVASSKLVDVDAETPLYDLSKEYQILDKCTWSRGHGGAPLLHTF
jgi:hypothetical protein